MKTTIETITPQQAAKWLQAHVNHDNRVIRQTQVEFLASQIMTGKWMTTHQGIAFSKGGRLLDGQHRLAAIVLAGKAVQMQVSTGCNDETFKVLDIGIKRQHCDRVHLVDDLRQNRLICTLLTTYIRETVHHHGIATSELEDAFLMHDGKAAEAWIWVSQEWKVKTQGLGIAGILASLAIYFMVNRTRAMLFNDGYKTGAELAMGSPILALRRLALDNPKRADYWTAQAAMRQHLAERSYTASSNGVRVFSASEDMMGNKNSIRLIRERNEARLKAAETKRKKRTSV